MSDTAIATATTFLGYMPRSVEYAGNTTQEIVIPVSDSREYMVTSEKALASIWMNAEEDEAWKDL